MTAGIYTGLIKDFVIGEQWSKFELRTLTLIDRMPKLYKPQSGAFSRGKVAQNIGLTVV